MFAQCVSYNFSYCPPNRTVTLSEGYSQFDIVVELYLISVLCIIGLFGNAVSFVVMRADKERREPLFLLQALALADAFYVIMAILNYPLRHLVSDYTYVHIKYLANPLRRTAQTTTIWMMVLVTCDRYIYVCKPLRAHQIFNSRSRRLIAAGVFIMGFIYNIPRFLENCIMTIVEPCSREKLYTIAYQYSFTNPLYYYIYVYGMYMLFLYISPLVALVYMNYRLIRAINHSIRRHREISPQRDVSHCETNATIVLVIIVLVFIVCETPELVVSIVLIIDKFIPGDQYMSFVKFSVTSELLMVINSSVNFFIYLVFGKRFRHIMRETFKYKSLSSLQTHETVPLQHPQLYRG